MRYLAFDQATRLTGYVVLDRDPGSGLLTLIKGEVIDYKKVPELLDRLVLLFKEVTRLIEEFCPDVVVVEDIYLGKNIKGFEKLAKVQAIIQVCTMILGKTIVNVSPMTARKQYDLTCKEDTAEFVCNLFPTLSGMKLDVTDAALLGLYASKK